MQTQLRVCERQVVHAAEQSTEDNPVVSRKISPEHRILFLTDEVPHRELAILAARDRVPAANPDSDYVAADGLMGYGSDFADTAHQIAAGLDRGLQSRMKQS
jgi:hypothetical protein